jgi:carbamoyl-phosphate synthase small subunit
MNGILALEDGTVFRGTGFGAEATACGEAVFNTSMTGYQEILTDPSYKGQIVAMTCPQVGNCGVNAMDVESWRPHIGGFLVRELSAISSNWRADLTLNEYLTRFGIPAVHRIDTRALTTILRMKGALKACISTEPMSEQAAVDLARQWPGIEGVDYVREVSHAEAFVWADSNAQSRPWHLRRTKGGQIICEEELPPVEFSVVAFDFGLKYNILRRLRQTGAQIQVVPATTTAETALSYRPQGVLLSNGPGDPEVLDYAHKTVHGLLGKVPIFGICLGHQILGHALGGQTFKLKFGHRGGNQPVKDLASGRVAITSQNHGFAVDPTTLPSEVEVTHVNLNDQTVEGMRHRDLPVFSVQYHPEASPGPHDAVDLFAEFRSLIERQ